MVVAADEHFTRCPVSQEPFLPVWDYEEGDYMYRNAVKVLVTAKADSSLFHASAPTNHSLFRYAIVHQYLVMDRWLREGKAVSLRNAIALLASSPRNDDIIASLRTAADEEDDDGLDDVFVLLEGNNKTIGFDLHSTTSEGYGSTFAYDEMKSDENYEDEGAVVEDNEDDLQNSNEIRNNENDELAMDNNNYSSTLMEIDDAGSAESKNSEAVDYITC